MIRNFTKQLLSATLCLLLVMGATPSEARAQQTPQTQQAGAPGYSGQGAPLSAEELQQMVAPIALYPDALVAQVCSAATFPDQIAVADYWLQQNKTLTGAALGQAVDQQTWDPSVKALTQFPSVLDKMAQNLAWTSSLGEAFHNQQADVLAAIQTLRAKAKAAGNLNSSPQITVIQQSPQTIVIQPTNPQIVYVPEYNPTVIYGTPYVTPGYSAGTVAAAGIIGFGAGIAVGAMMSSGGCCGWSYSSWNCNWHGGAVAYHGTAYYGNAAWHGGYYGTSGSAYGPNGSAHYGSGYNPSTGTYARGATTSTAYGTQKVGQAYNPNTGAYGQTHQTSNAYGSYGNSEVSKNGQTAYTQHQTTSQGSVGSMQSTNGAKAVAGTGKYNSGTAGETASGNKYATADGNAYKNTGSGWQKDTNGTWNNVQKPSGSSSSSAASHGWGGEDKSGGGSSAWGGGDKGGWGSRSSSSRGWASRGGGGGWGRR